MKRSLSYRSGEDIQQGDRIHYHGEPGTVEFVVSEKTGDPGLDWFIEKWPGGGCMINARNFGNVFLTGTEEDEDLDLVARGSQ